MKTLQDNLLCSRCRSAFIALLMISVGGCASGQPTEPQAGMFADKTGTDAAAVRSLLVKDENGLEIRQIVVEDQLTVIAAALGRFETSEHQRPAVDAATAERLRRNGFRLVRVPIDELDQLIVEMGGATLDMNSWHGQVYEWRDLHALGVGAQRRALAVDGRVRTYSGGELRLTARGWVTPMEDGPHLQLEVVPRHVRSESRYHQLLGQSNADAQPLSSMAMHLLLEPGYAYVLTCECPQADWQATDRDDHGPSHSNAPIGPEVQVPTTVGQLMLSSEVGRPSRGMMIFTPRISSKLLSHGHQVSTHKEQSQ